MAMPAGLRRYWASRRRKGGRRSASMARRRSVRSRRAGFRLPLAIVGGFMPLVSREMAVAQSQGLGAVPADAARGFLPYNTTTRRFDASGLSYGLIPVTVGVLVHKIIGGAFGLNRALAAAGIPFVRL